MPNQHIEIVRKAYAAFAAGNLDTVLGLLHENAEWTITGESAIGGNHRGKAEISELFQRLAQKSTVVEPKSFYADGDVVIVLAEVNIEGGRFPEADVYTLDGGKLVKAQSFGDTAAQQRIFGAKQSATRV